MSGHVVLVGAGHANLAIVRRARRLQRHGVGITLVDPDAFWYSGMAAAVLGGAVAPARDVIDPGAAAGRRGVEFVAGRVTHLDPASGVVTVDDRRELVATAIVLNVGSDVEPFGLPTERDDVTPAKPIRGLLALHDRLVIGPTGARVVIIGGGATAIETAGNLTAGPVARAVAPEVTVVAGPDPLEAVTDPAIRRRILRPLLARGVTWEEGVLAEDVTDDGVVLADGRTLLADHVVLATGLRASWTVEALGLGDADGMPVTPTLQHPEHPRLLGAGDAVRFGPAGLPRLGVYAVRQVPVLLDNLEALHTGAPLRPFEPPAEVLTAIDLGGRDAVLLHRGRCLSGRPAHLAKRLLDEWYLRRHRATWVAHAPRTVHRQQQGGRP